MGLRNDYWCTFTIFEWNLNTALKVFKILIAMKTPNFATFTISLHMRCIFSHLHDDYYYYYISLLIALSSSKQCKPLWYIYTLISPLF